MSSGHRLSRPTLVIAALTRRLQALSPNRPLKGLTRLSNLMECWASGYRGVIRLQEIDLVFQEQRWVRVDVIKMDIEGNDCNALLGARETLTRFRPVIAFEYGYSTPPEIAEAAFGLLDDLGYRLAELRRNGNRVPIDWRIVGNLDHIDVVGAAGGVSDF